MFHSFYRTTRAELYEKAWASPLLKVAAEIGVSDVALAKACRKAGIPLPPQGHWLKKGKPGRRPELRARADGAGENVVFKVVDRAEIERIRAQAPPPPALTPGVPTPVVPDSLRGAHPLVLATKRRGNDHFHGRIYLVEGSLDLRVSPEQFDRCRRIASALIKASESLGFRWEVKDNKTRVSLGSTHFEVHFTERISKQPSASKARWADDVWLSTGELAFSVDTYTPEPVRKLWKDSSTGTLEERLADVVATFPRVIAGVQLHEAQLRDWRRNYEEERDRERRAAEEAAMQRLLFDRLMSTTTGWENAQRIRSFCEAVSGLMSEMTPESRDATANWLAWAVKQADGLDPLKSQSLEWMKLSTDPAKDRKPPGW